MMKIKDGKLLKYEGNEKIPVIPLEVTEICADAFRDCRSLEMIMIPENVRQIGERAFAGCTNLERLYLISAVDIAEHAFRDCASLRELYIPYNSRVIPSAFENCTGLKQVFKWDTRCGIRRKNEMRIWDYYEDPSPNMSRVLSDCVFIRCNDLVKESHFGYLEEIIRFMEEREIIYRELYGCRIRGYTFYDDYDPRLAADKVTVLGCGNSGSQIKEMLSRHITDGEVYCAAVSGCVAYPPFSDHPEHIALYEDNENCCCGGLSPGGSPENMVPDAVTYLYKYLPVIKNSRMIFVTGGAAGAAASVLMTVIIMAAFHYGIPVRAFVTLPFLFEGKRRTGIAEDTLHRLEFLLGGKGLAVETSYFWDADKDNIGELWEKKKELIVSRLLDALEQEGVKTCREAGNDQKG